MCLGAQPLNPSVTIISLIYQSPRYAIGFWKSIQESTPQLASGEATFYFVANNANQKTKRALIKHKIPYIDFERIVLSNEQHFKLGFAKPEYIGRVYSAYNFGIQECKTPKVVLLNSDMVLSPGWLTKLLATDHQTRIVSPILVERNHPRFGIFPGALEGNFGHSFESFDKKRWLNFLRLQQGKADVMKPSGPFMPALFNTDWFSRISYYPEGNLRNDFDSYENVSEYGDEYLFRIFQEAGIPHVSHSNVYCYHFKEGERSTLIFQSYLNRFSQARRLVGKLIRFFN